MSIVVFNIRRFVDDRGWFAETFSARRFLSHANEVSFCQDNCSYSKSASTVRGLHFQVPPHAQGKLVSCTRGAIFDVAVDIRRGSPTYGQHVSVELSAANGRQVYIPAGFAHGLITLEPDTEVAYKVTDFYSPECDAGLVWNDADLNINWPSPSSTSLLSPKDAALPRFKDFQSPFTYDGTPMSLTEIA